MKKKIGNAVWVLRHPELSDGKSPRFQASWAPAYQCLLEGPFSWVGDPGAHTSPRFPHADPLEVERDLGNFYFFRLLTY